MSQLLFVATCDLAAIVRGRALPDPGGDLPAAGTGWVPADLALTAFGGIAEDNRFGSTGDLRLLPDPASLVELPADGVRPAQRLVLADQVGLDGSPWGGCPRTFLRTALADLAAQGLALTASFEHEFMLPDLAGSAPFSWARARAAEPFGSELVGLLESIGFDPENWLPEYGSGQFEVTLAPRGGLAAADRAIVLRELVRDLAAGHGRRATFVPLRHPAGTGNGVHVHLSLQDDHGRNVLYDPDAPGRLSEPGRRFAAGILAHAAAVCAVTAPTRVSYLRLTPHRWSAGGAFLAERNREAMLRICPTPTLAGGDPERSLHLEFRAADATANPWLVLGILVRAGLAGLHGCQPAYVHPEDTDEAVLAAEPALPASLEAALAAFESDPLVLEHFPAELRETYLSVKRAELAELAELDDVAACERLADVY